MRFLFLFIINIITFLAFTGLVRADIIIGVAGPITGPSAAFGEQLQRGATEAAKLFNINGGINGEKIHIVIGDDMSDPRQGISVANKFVADGIKFVLGHFNSGVSIPTSEVYAENSMLQISPSTTNPIFTERGLWNVFRVCGRDDQQGVVAGRYLAEKFKNSAIAILHDKTPYGQGLADEVKKSLHDSGIKEVMYEGINIGDKDFSALIGKMKYKNVSIIYWGGLHTEAGLIIRQMRDQDLKAKLVSGDGIVSNELAAITGDAVIGTLNTFGLDPSLNSENAALLKKFKDSGFNPEAYTLYSYAAIEILVEAIKRANSKNPRDVAKVMKASSENPFKTVLGEISFDEKGDPNLPKYEMYEWKKNDKGRYVYVPY